MPPQNDSWFGKDKAKHFFVSGVIAGISTSVSENREIDSDESFLLSTGITLSIGMGKEAHDLWLSQTGWSWKDLLWDLLGALAGHFFVQGID